MKKLFCLILGHRYRTLRAYSPTQRRVYCQRCKEQYAMYDTLQALLPWDGEFAELYQDFA